MNKFRAFGVAAVLLTAAAVLCYAELRFSQYPDVQGRALAGLAHHLQFVTLPFSVAALLGLWAISSAARPRSWHFALAGAVVTPPALMPSVYAGSSGEPLATLALVSLVAGVPLGIASALLVWFVSRRNAVQLAVQRDGPASGGSAR